MKNFTFARKWHDILKSYPEEIQKEVYRAAIEYAFTGESVDMQPLARMAFDFIRYEIDEKARRREARLAKKQAQEALAENSSVVSRKKEKKDGKKDDAEKTNAGFNVPHTTLQPATAKDSAIPNYQHNRSTQPVWLF
ncbi:MAG: hypothetical protein K2H84_05865 [Paramuribaculum sp.]|nr:hypothetical protein [Paramuribaculum sp.]